MVKWTIFSLLFNEVEESLLEATFNISFVIDSNLFIISILFYSEFSTNFIPFLMSKSSPSLYDTILLSSK